MNHNTNSLQSIASVFAEMTDQRKPKGIRYQFQPLLILLSLAKLCLQDTPSEIADWVQNRSAFLKKKLGLNWKRMPSQSTWQRLLGQNIDAADFDKKVGKYFQSLASQEEESKRQLCNLDGKVACGTVSSDEQLHLLALAESEASLVIEQTELRSHENEITAARRLLGRARLKDKIVSGDAIFAQKELSATVIEKGGEYIWKLRTNQGKIHEMAAAFFSSGTDKYTDKARSVEKGHGRIDEREIQTSFRLAAKIEFPSLEQVFRIERTSTEIKTGKTSRQTVYGITSLPVEEFRAKELLEIARKHWEIENGLHRRRDVTFKEDSIRQTSKNGGRVLATLNNLTIGILRKLKWQNIAKARRYFNSRIDRALKVILTPLTLLL